MVLGCVADGDHKPRKPPYALDEIALESGGEVMNWDDVCTGDVVRVMPKPPLKADAPDVMLVDGVHDCINGDKMITGTFQTGLVVSLFRSQWEILDDDEEADE